jgi:hypothetical protein
MEMLPERVWQDGEPGVSWPSFMRVLPTKFDPSWNASKPVGFPLQCVSDSILLFYAEISIAEFEEADLVSADI